MPVNVLIRYRASAPMPDNNYEETLHQFERRIRLGTAGPGVVSAHGCGVSRAFSTQVLELAYFSSVIHQLSTNPGRRSFGEGDINYPLWLNQEIPFGSSSRS
jgi:hypothetical protein